MHGKLYVYGALWLLLQDGMPQHIHLHVAEVMLHLFESNKRVTSLFDMVQTLAREQDIGL